MGTMPYVVSPRAHLAAIILLSMLTFAFGFMSAFPNAPGHADVAEQLEQAAPDSVQSTDVVTSPVPAEKEAPIVGKSAVFSCVLRYPFESVLKAWEGGPPDPNFIKEDVKVELHGSEERKHKTIYTKNPLPYVIRKTLIRDEMFVFEENQRIDLKDRFSMSSCDNRVLESIVKAHRSASMRADPQNPNWTLFEQSMSFSISGIFGQTVKAQLESFAESLFLSAAQSGTKMLEETLAAEEERIASAALKADGGGVWWTGGAETVPGTNTHSPEPAVPEDSSSGFLSETLESWTNWMWPSRGGVEADADSQDRENRAKNHASSALGSVWWYDGDEGGAWGDMGRSIVIEPLPAGVVEAEACRSEAGEEKRRPLENIARLARQAGSPAVMLAGIAAHVASVGGAQHEVGAGRALEGSGGDSQKERQRRPLGSLGRPMRRDREDQEITEKVREAKTAGARFPLQSLRRMRQGVGAVSSGAGGAVAAFVSANLD